MSGDPVPEREEIVYRPVPEQWNHLSGRVIRAAMEVHRVLGPGLLERIYEEALAYELESMGIGFKRQVPIQLRYKGRPLPLQKMDLIVEGLIVIELKALERVPEIHLAQLVSYLRSADIPLGLLLNFNVPLLKQGIYRRINPHATAILRLPTLTKAANPLSSDSSLSSSGPSGFSGTSELNS